MQSKIILPPSLCPPSLPLDQWKGKLSILQNTVEKFSLHDIKINSLFRDI